METNMKIVHISLEDSFGAGRAAIRISNAIKKQGVDSKVYVLRKNEMADSYIIKLGRVQKIAMNLLTRVNQILLKKYPQRGYFHKDTYGINLMKNEEIRSADIIHFHWINDGIWSDSFIKGILKLKKPVVWTMHDMWTFTGGCHYDEFCGKYRGHCGNCKVLASNKKRDISYRSQTRKKLFLSKMNIQLVGCSNWITKQANESYIGGSLKKRAICIPNPTDVQHFKIYDRELCRRMLDINTQKKLILFGAVNAASDERKGAKYILEAIKQLDSSKYMLGVFGSKNVAMGLDEFEIINFGRISDDFHLSLIYNAADVFVAPSLQENLANTVMESLTCGTPVVAFNIGGMSDMILHMKNGYLVKAFDVIDLAHGIENVTELSKEKVEIRKTMSERFSEEQVGNAYLEMYKQILNGKGK